MAKAPGRYIIEVPFTVTEHHVAKIEIEADFEETAKCEATAQVRAAHVRPIIHDARIIGFAPLEVVGD